MVFRFWIEWQNTNAVNLQTQLTQVIMDVARREGINIPVPDPHRDAAEPDRACRRKRNDSLNDSESFAGGPSWVRTGNQRFMRALL